MTSAHKRLLHTGLQNYDHVDLDAGAIFFAQALRLHHCPCCAIGLLAFEHELPTTPLKPGLSRLRWLHLEICPACGWWHFRQDYESADPSSPGDVMRSTWWELTHAVQAEIELGTTSTLPIEMLQHHLRRRWEDRKLISAQQAEDLVASLLQEHHGGRVSRITANANVADGGIDLYITAGDDGSIRRAVQVSLLQSGLGPGGNVTGYRIYLNGLTPTPFSEQISPINLIYLKLCLELADVRYIKGRVAAVQEDGPGLSQVSFVGSGRSLKFDRVATRYGTAVDGQNTAMLGELRRKQHFGDELLRFPQAFGAVEDNRGRITKRYHNPAREGLALARNRFFGKDSKSKIAKRLLSKVRYVAMIDYDSSAVPSDERFKDIEKWMRGRLRRGPPPPFTDHDTYQF